MQASNSKIPIVFAFDENYKLPASVAISSLLASKNPDTEYEIFVLYDELSAETINRFNDIANINWIKFPKDICNGFPVSENYSISVYYRLFIHELIKTYDKIIWSDVDVFFRGDLCEIYSININDYFWAGVIEQKNDYNMVGHKFLKENKNDYIFFSGFMIINAKKMREKNIINAFIDIINNHGHELGCFDLEILNAACNNIKSIPITYCMVESIYVSENFDNAYDWHFLKTAYSKDELISAKEKAIIIHYNYNYFPKIWLRTRKYIPDYYWDFLIKSPFFNEKDHEVAFYEYFLFVLCCIGIHILPIKKWRKKLRRLRRVFLQRLGYLQNP